LRTLEKILREGKPVRTLVVGDLILDRYVEGKVERINPEAPVPVVHARKERLSLGGAANTARNLKVLGGSVRLLGAVGQDDDGEALRGLCAENGIAGEGILSDPERQTTKKTRVIARGAQLVRVDWEDPVPLGKTQEAKLLAEAFLGPDLPEMIVLSDYGKGVLTPSVLEHLIREGEEKGIPVLVDPKGRDFEKYTGAFLVTPNRKEAEGWIGNPLVEEADFKKALTALKEKLRLRASVITLGPEGLAWLDEKGEFGRLQAQAREVFDITGAGDTVIATLAYFLGSGLPLKDALGLANLAAGISVGRVGAVAVGREEILERLLGTPPLSRKILDREGARTFADAERRDGKTVVFTNGCFDILHRGHVEYLRFCREQGDSLIVGLNADTSVSKLKGPGRPLNQETDRATLLAALESVDAVVVFDEETPANIIRVVEPDVLVKGEDWREKGVVGREFVEARGGKVILAPLLEGFSTSDILQRLRGDSREEPSD
jgi:D-beta-D-heptose 7-phosphate kinase/D-beta-D-heptose 1-phosphate adenosyltransferase